MGFGQSRHDATNIVRGLFHLLIRMRSRPIAENAPHYRLNFLHMIAAYQQRRVLQEASKDRVEQTNRSTLPGTI